MSIIQFSLMSDIAFHRLMRAVLFFYFPPFCKINKLNKYLKKGCEKGIYVQEPMNMKTSNF